MTQSGDLEHAVGSLIRAPSEFRPSQLQSMLCDARCARFPADVARRPTGDDRPVAVEFVECVDDRLLGVAFSLDEDFPSSQRPLHQRVHIFAFGCYEVDDDILAFDRALRLYHGGCAIVNQPLPASVVELLCALLELACEFGAFVVDGDEGGAGAHVVGLEAVDLETVHPSGAAGGGGGGDGDGPPVGNEQAVPSQIGRAHV